MLELSQNLTCNGACMCIIGNHSSRILESSENSLCLKLADDKHVCLSKQDSLSDENWMVCVVYRVSVSML